VPSELPGRERDRKSRERTELTSPRRDNKALCLSLKGNRQGVVVSWFSTVLLFYAKVSTVSSYGVVATVVAPTLKGVRQSDLIKFEIEYDAYKERVADVNRSRDASRRIQPASIRHCIDASLLHSLCILGQIDSATQLSEATDVNVKKWFEDRLQTSPEDLTERVRSALDSVQYSVDRKDPSGAALAFVVNVVTALDKSNASEVVKTRTRVSL